MGAEVQVCDFRGWRREGLSYTGRQKQEERLSPPRRGRGETYRWAVRGAEVAGVECGRASRPLRQQEDRSRRGGVTWQKEGGKVGLVTGKG